jgi:hypothetical protein
MRKLLSLALFYVPLVITAQRNYSAAEISRLADLGKVWAYGTISILLCPEVSLLLKAWYVKSLQVLPAILRLPILRTAWKNG